ncbi:MAG: RnfH family protein [Gammaproteobacteria bacterium]|nr:RnfH family protein [Gammaproteobacteria bacterium]
MEKNDAIVVECVYASTTQQTLVSLRVPINATIREVIIASGILNIYSELVLDTLEVGIFSQQKSLNDTVTNGDRVEIYRPLLIHPMEARRQRAPARKRKN